MVAFDKYEMTGDFLAMFENILHDNWLADPGGNTTAVNLIKVSNKILEEIHFDVGSLDLEKAKSKVDVVIRINDLLIKRAGKNAK